MTAHVHDQDDQGARARTARTRARPCWLVPAIIIATVAGGLVVAGVVPLSTVLSAGLFGGMILMHLGGHGSHGSHGGHAAHGSGPADAGPVGEAGDGPDGEAGNGRGP